MNKTEPTLVIMAAGLGSRFGGLKQITPVDGEGHIIIDFSMYDALKAGFKKIVCIINPKNEKDFTEHFKNVPLEYAFQTLELLPSGYGVPYGREKPWGTAHAIHAAASRIGGPFAVINADDFYGFGSFKLVYDFLRENGNKMNPSVGEHMESENGTAKSATKNKFAVVGYRIENTITESGSVARGVLEIKDGRLSSIDEMTEVVLHDGVVTNKGTVLPPGTLVSMNMWGFTGGLLKDLESRFKVFLDTNLKENPLKCEFLLPILVSDLIKDGVALVEVLPSVEKWYGVTYAADMPGVKSAIERMKLDGIYPKKLWG